MPTDPGVSSLFELNPFSMAERQALMRLSQQFYITRAAQPVQMGNSSYRACLMRPTEGMSIVLNVEREIVALFANYPTFESRTLLAYDKIYEQFDDIRIDRSLRFLISSDDNIEQTIHHYLVQNPEYPIVIPFKFSDFKSPNDTFIFAAIRRNYVIRDLFGYQSPLKQEYFFFGRTKLLENVLDQHKSGQNSGLFGLRKSGKTSTIYAIQRRAKASEFRTVVIDCQDPATHALRYSSLLELIIKVIRIEFSMKNVEISLGKSPDQVSRNFRRLMNDALSTAGRDVLVIFDEIENISPQTAASPHWKNADDAALLWQILRAFFQTPRNHKITFCFVGTNPHLVELPKFGDVDNPVYLFAPKTFIPMLSLPETSEMITRLGYFMGLDFSPAVVAHIHQRFGGHPFFIRQLCSQIHKKTSLNRPREVSIAACRDAEADSGADLQRYMKEILNTLKSFYPDEYAMVEYLAKGEKSKFSEMAKYDAAYVEHLIGYGLIVRRGDDHEFAFAALEDAVKNTISNPSSPGISEKWIIVSERRNKLEEEIRGALYHWSMRLKPDEWSEGVNACLSGKRKSELGPITRQEAFSRNESKLYFLELMQFIRHSHLYDDVQASFGGDIFQAMDIVNKGRIDAHAKTIEDGQYGALLEAFDLLESVFVQP